MGLTNALCWGEDFSGWGAHFGEPGYTREMVIKIPGAGLDPYKHTYIHTLIALQTARGFGGWALG